MKRLLPFAVLLLLLAPGCALVDPSPQAKVEQDVAAKLWLTNCAGCHGLNGQPSDTIARDLRNWPGSFQVLDSTLNTGPSVMPKFPEIDEASRHLLFDYIKKFH
ncbi:MAG: cytochrome c [Bacteroidetes bacterium]|nr:cytochrome c [Bacteroidota bacterium]